MISKIGKSHNLIVFSDQENPKGLNMIANIG